MASRAKRDDTTPKCASCGKYIGYFAMQASRLDFTPLNEFGPEISDWTCPPCLDRERARDRWIGAK